MKKHKEEDDIYGCLDNPSGLRWFDHMYSDLNSDVPIELPWDGFPQPPSGTIDVWDEKQVKVILK